MLLYLSSLRKKFVEWQEDLAERMPWVFMVFVTVFWAISVILFALLFSKHVQWITLIGISLVLGLCVSFLARRNLKRQGRWGNSKKGK
jgi:Flp pilus assembly protein TadB